MDEWTEKVNRQIEKDNVDRQRRAREVEREFGFSSPLPPHEPTIPYSPHDSVVPITCVCRDKTGRKI